MGTNTNQLAFVQRYLKGRTILSEIYEDIELWKKGGSTLPIHEFLGMSENDYEAFTKDNMKLDAIVNSYKTLQHWINDQNISWVDKQIEKHLDKRIVRQVNSARMDWDEYLKLLHTCAPFKAKYVYSFVVLENGIAVGLNENPAKGLSTPIVKFKELPVVATKTQTFGVGDTIIETID